jgi:predicted ribosome quality control (RQC) complex YloA/Tae2 family protein
VATLKKHLLGFNETMVREVLARAAFEPKEDAGFGRAEAAPLAQKIKEIASRFKDTQSGYLYAFKRGIEVYPLRLSSGDVQPEKFKTLSLAVMAMVTRRRSTVEGEDREKGVLKAVARAVKRMERRLVKLTDDVEKASGFEKYKRHAELLQIHRGELKKGMRSVEVDDVMSDPALTIKIKLDPALSPNENIEQYFRQHRKGREGLSLLRRRLEVSKQELQSLQEMQQELEADFNSAEQRYQSEIASLMPRVRQPEAVQPRLPYKEATLSTGVTIFVGRDGSDNDRTTFEFTRPYELWFHAQQCAGSHVVIKYPGKSFEPSKREIEETAAIAAYHSRARNDSLVPVIYTQRKHVRKPRKAKPGLVLVEREKSIMVEPKKPG